MNHQTRVYNDVFEMLPSEENPSPIVRINRLNPSPEFQLYAKLEWLNPFGSVKDRAAWAMLRELEEKGEVGNGRGLVEPTSGNTGISLAAMAKARGYHMRAVVPIKSRWRRSSCSKFAARSWMWSTTRSARRRAWAMVRSISPRPTPRLPAIATPCPISMKTNRMCWPTCARPGPRFGARLRERWTFLSAA